MLPSLVIERMAITRPKTKSTTYSLVKINPVVIFVSENNGTFELLAINDPSYAPGLHYQLPSSEVAQALPQIISEPSHTHIALGSLIYNILGVALKECRLSRNSVTITGKVLPPPRVPGFGWVKVNTSKHDSKSHSVK